MAKIVEIKKRTNNDAIDMLKKAIVEIEAGNIVDAAIAYVTSDSGIGYEFRDADKAILLGAALSMAERSFHKLIDEQ